MRCSSLLCSAKRTWRCLGFGYSVRPEAASRRLYREWRLRTHSSYLLPPDERLRLNPYAASILWLKHCRIEDHLLLNRHAVLDEKAIYTHPRASLSINRCRCFPSNVEAIPIPCTIQRRDCHIDHRSEHLRHHIDILSPRECARAGEMDGCVRRNQFRHARPSRGGPEGLEALVVIGYDLGPSNDQLRRILGLSHPGSARLVERLVADGLVERRDGRDKRAVALYLTKQGKRLRKTLLKGRLAVLHPFLVSFTDSEVEMLTALLHKMLSSLEPTDLERCTLCRLCDDSVCTNCPIPADFRGEHLQKA